MDDAALAWSLKYWPKSNLLQSEYATVIYGAGSYGYYFADTQTQYKQRSVSVNRILENPSEPYFAQAIMHTHPYTNIFTNHEIFSPNDLGYSAGWELPIYVATPGGNLFFAEGQLAYGMNGITGMEKTGSKRTVQLGIKYTKLSFKDGSFID